MPQISRESIKKTFELRCSQTDTRRNGNQNLTTPNRSGSSLGKNEAIRALHYKFWPLGKIWGQNSKRKGWHAPPYTLVKAWCIASWTPISFFLSRLPPSLIRGLATSQTIISCSVVSSTDRCKSPPFRPIHFVALSIQRVLGLSILKAK